MHIRASILWSNIKRLRDIRELHVYGSSMSGELKRVGLEGGLNRAGLDLLAAQIGPFLRVLDMESYALLQSYCPLPHALVRNVKELSIAGNPHLTNFVQGFNRFLSLETLSLSFESSFSMKHFRCLQSIRPPLLPKLRHLSITGRCGLRDQEVVELRQQVQALLSAYHLQIEVLDLSEYWVPLTYALRDALSSRGFRALRVLKLTTANTSSWRHVDQSSVYEAIGRAAAENHLPLLHSLHLEYKRITSACSFDPFVAQRLAAGCQLSELHLMNGVGGEAKDLKTILKVAATMPSLRSLVITSSIVQPPPPPGAAGYRARIPQQRQEVVFGGCQMLRQLSHVQKLVLREWRFITTMEDLAALMAD